MGFPHSGTMSSVLMMRLVRLAEQTNVTHVTCLFADAEKPTQTNRNAIFASNAGAHAKSLSVAKMGFPHLPNIRSRSSVPMRLAMRVRSVAPFTMGRKNATCATRMHPLAAGLTQSKRNAVIASSEAFDVNRSNALMGNFLHGDTRETTLPRKVSLSSLGQRSATNAMRTAQSAKRPVQSQRIVAIALNTTAHAVQSNTLAS
jgi:hypothetical protein